MSKIKETDILQTCETFKDKPTFNELYERYIEMFPPVSKQLLRSYIIYHNLKDKIQPERSSVGKEIIISIIKKFNKQNIKPTIQQILTEYQKKKKYSRITEDDLRQYIIDQELFWSTPKPQYDEDY